MKSLRTLCAVASLLTLAGPHSAAAQVFGQYGGATPVGVNDRLFGTAIAFTQNTTELLGQLRLSFYPGVDFGFQGGLAHSSASGVSRTAVELGGDVKVLVAKRTDAFPVDIALGGGVGVSSADDFNQLMVGPSAVASRTMPLGGHAQWVPYAGVAVTYTRSDVHGVTVTDMALPVRLGVELRPGADYRLLSELQLAAGDSIHDGVKFILGANFPF